MVTETERGDHEEHTLTEGVSFLTRLGRCLQDCHGASHGLEDTCTRRALCVDFTRRTEQGTDCRKHTSPWPRALGIYYDGTKSPQLPRNPLLWLVVQELRVHSGSETKCLPSSCSPLTLLLSSHLGGFSTRSSSQTSDRAAETPLTLCSSSGMPHLPNPEFLRGALQGTLSQTVVHERNGTSMNIQPGASVCHGFISSLE